MQHVIRFNADVSWEGQSNGLPKTLHAFVIFEGDDSAAINDIVERQSGAFLKVGAFFCQKDQGSIIDMRQVPQERMLIPMQWITRLTVDVTAMVGELSMPDKDGVERLANGEEPQKH